MPRTFTSHSYTNSTQDQIERLDAQLTGQSIVLANILKHLSGGDEGALDKMQNAFMSSNEFDELMPIDLRNKQEANSIYMETFSQARKSCKAKS